MSILRKNRLFFSLALPLALGALLLGSFFDLPLSRAVYRERAPLGFILEAVCFLPLYAPLALAALAGAAQAGSSNMIKSRAAIQQTGETMRITTSFWGAGQRG